MQRARLEGVGLRRSFGSTDALRDVSFELFAGEILTVLGPNGAGKSTLLSLIAGALRPDAGGFLVDGEESTLTTPDWRHRIGVVSHASGVYDHLTARENLTFFAALYGLGGVGDRVSRALEWVGLEGAADRPTDGFSRGMLQRLSLARALLHDPDVLLLDEPFTGMDRAGFDDLAGRLESWRSSRSILLVTHHLEVGADLADRILLLRSGQVAYHGADHPTGADFGAFYAEHTAAPVEAA